MKEQIKQEVVKILKDFCDKRYEKIELPTEGSLTDTYHYMSLKNVNLALELCFEETYKRTNNE
jgi:acyl carrier protein